MGDDDDIKIIGEIYPWTHDSLGNTITITTENSSVFTRYPDLSSRQVREGLGIDVVQDIKRNLDE